MRNPEEYREVILARVRNMKLCLRQIERLLEMKDDEHAVNMQESLLCLPQDFNGALTAASQFVGWQAGQRATAKPSTSVRTPSEQEEADERASGVQ